MTKNKSEEIVIEHLTNVKPTNRVARKLQEFYGEEIFSLRANLIDGLLVFFVFLGVYKLIEIFLGLF